MYISVWTRVLVSPWKGGFKSRHIWQCTMFCCCTTLKNCETTSRCGVSRLQVVHLTGLKTILCSRWKNNHPISGWSVYDVFACHFAEKTGRKNVSWHLCWCYISSRDTWINVFGISLLLNVKTWSYFRSVNTHIRDVDHESHTCMSNP